MGGGECKNSLLHGVDMECFSPKADVSNVSPPRLLSEAEKGPVLLKAIRIFQCAIYDANQC